MRNRDVIEREIDRARADLQASVGELKHVIQDKLDIKAHVHRALEHKKDDAKIALIHGREKVVELAKRGKDGAIELAERGKDGIVQAAIKSREGVVHAAVRSKDGIVHAAGKSKDGIVFAYQRSSETVRERPYLFAGILVGVLAATATIIYLQRR